MLDENIDNENERDYEKFTENEIKSLHKIILDLEQFAEIYADKWVDFNKIIEDLEKFKKLLEEDVIKDITENLVKPYFSPVEK